MSDNTVCTRCEEGQPGIGTFIPFVGDLKQRIGDEICNVCWLEWKDMQIKIINEYRLHMGEASHRESLKDFAFKFFCFDGGDGSLGGGEGPEGGLA